MHTSNGLPSSASRWQEKTDRVVNVTSTFEPLGRFAQVALFVSSAAALPGCSGDHDLLAQKQTDSGAPIDAALVDIRGDERRIVVPPGDVVDAWNGDAMDRSQPPNPPEPPGRFSFTWMNGLVDVESARFCFVPIVGDRELRDRAVAAPVSLLFGKSVVFSQIGDIDLSAMNVHPYAVVGANPGSDGGPTCAAILDAEDAGVNDDGSARDPVAVPLPVIPAGTLAEGRSYLGVVTGCARRWPYADVDASTDGGDASDAKDGSDGGQDTHATDTDGAVDPEGGADAPRSDATPDVFRPPARAAICGASTGAPNAGLVVVRLSRRDVGARFGFQAVHASTAVAAARMAIERTGGSVPVLTADIGPYQIVPRDGLIAVTLDDLGPTFDRATLRVASPSSMFPAVTAPLASALAASDIDEARLVLGDRFSLVLIGAEPGQNPGPPWNASRVAVVRNAPFTLGD
jgi:hypothetical protein